MQSVKGLKRMVHLRIKIVIYSLIPNLQDHQIYMTQMLYWSKQMETIDFQLIDKKNFFFFFYIMYVPQNKVEQV